MTDKDKKGNGGDEGARHLSVVTQLKTDHQKRNERCILKLEELLAQARQGQYVGMIFVGIQPGPRTTGWYFTGRKRTRKSFCWAASKF